MTYNEFVSYVAEHGYRNSITHYVHSGNYTVSFDGALKTGKHIQLTFPLHISDEYARACEILKASTGDERLSYLSETFKDDGDGAVSIYPIVHEAGDFRAYNGIFGGVIMYGDEVIHPLLLNGGNCDYLYDDIDSVERFIGVYKDHLLYDNGARIYMIAPDGNAVYVMESFCHKYDFDSWSEVIREDTLMIKACRDGEYLFHTMNLEKCLKALKLEAEARPIGATGVIS